MDFDPHNITRFPPFAFKLRKFFRTPLIIWHLSLDWYAGRLLSHPRYENILDFQSLEIFKKRNEKFQKEMAEVFKSYHDRCQRCQFCCRLFLLCFHELDCVLYGLNPWFNAPFMQPPTRFHEIVKKFLAWITPTVFVRKLNELLRGKKESTEIVDGRCTCMMLGDHGCKFDYGQRPTICVLFLCDGLIGEMSWVDYRHYITASSKYLAFLTHSIKDVAAELSSLQRKP
jgi:hypothetical protein